MYELVLDQLMSNTLSTVKFLQKQGHASTNLCLRCGTVPEKYSICINAPMREVAAYVKHQYKPFWKWLEMQNTDPDITTFFAHTLLYIAGEGNDLTQCPNLALHSDIFRTVWLSITLGFFPKSLAGTHQICFTHIEAKERYSNGLANSSHKSGNSFTANGSTSLNSNTLEKNWKIIPSN